MPKSIPSLLLLALLLLVSCRTQVVYLPDTSTLAGLQAMANTKAAKSNSKAKMSKIRQMALQEVALSLGAQAGLAWRANSIDQALARQARNLDSIYDFNSLILEHNILPPVLLEGRNTLNLANEQTIRLSDRTYKVAKQARFITTPPNWRSYIWMDYQKPETPNQSLLPKNKQERKVWCDYVARGWQTGVEQADTILEESIARLKEDFAGMLLYRKLLAMNMISAPYVAHTDLGITGNESEMHIDDRVLRITALPQLNINSDEWQAAVAKDENALRQFSKMEKDSRNARIVITDKAWQPTVAPVNKAVTEYPARRE